MIRILACVCLVVCLAGSALARSQEKMPNLTGRWVLNPSLTKPKVPPGFDNKMNLVCCETKSAVAIIEHKGRDISITTNSVEVDNQGKETINESVTILTTKGITVIYTDDIEFHITTHWDSGKLISNTVSTDQRFVPSVEVRTISKDGKTMTFENYDRTIEGAPTLTMVFERSDN